MSAQVPDSPHRAALRELSQKITEQRVLLENVINPLTVHLQGGDAILGLSAEWMDLAPIPARLRILSQLPSMGAGAFVGEVEYEDGAEIDNVIVAESVLGVVMAGTFFMRIHATEPEHIQYSKGQSFFLDHGLRHGWRVEGRTRSLLVFTPPQPLAEPEPEPADDWEPTGCCVSPDVTPRAR